MYTYIDRYIYIYINIYIYIYIFIYVYICIYIYVYVCIYKNRKLFFDIQIISEELKKWSLLTY